MKKIYFLLCLLLSVSLLQASEYEPVSQGAQKQYLKRLSSWESLLQRLRSEKEFTKVRDVNAFFNRYRYKSDAYNWETVEYWATFKEFLTKGSGDCEDFALAKYYTLRQLGVSSNNLKLMTGLYGNKGHMILVYYKNAEPYILDKNNRYLIQLSQSKRFKAQTYFNENSYGLIDTSIPQQRAQKEFELFLQWWSQH